MKNCLLEGLPGVGKTTLIRKLADRISKLKIGGFYTQEIRENGRRVGFRVETFSGLSGILSHVSLSTGPRVGKYRVYVTAFEGVVVKDLEKALQTSDIILIDEIGKMELFSKHFKDVLLRCLDSDKSVIATVMLRPHAYVDRIKTRQDVEILEVTLGNRERLVDEIIGKVISECE
jgi:nucleoside-triphosphatase